MQRVVSHKRGATCIAGIFSFIAKDAHHGDMALSYNLLFELDSREQYPTVYETKGVIPRTEDNHIQANASICLGTPIQLHEFMLGKPSLCDFAEKIIIPYLYAITLKLLHYNMGEMVYGELSHGNLGLYEDLQEQFSVTSYSELQGILKTLSSNESIFEESICPYCKTRKIRKCLHFQKLRAWRSFIQKNQDYANLHKILLQESNPLERLRKLIFMQVGYKDSIFKEILKHIPSSHRRYNTRLTDAENAPLNKIPRQILPSR